MRRMARCVSTTPLTLLGNGRKMGKLRGIVGPPQLHYHPGTPTSLRVFALFEVIRAEHVNPSRLPVSNAWKIELPKAV